MKIRFIFLTLFVLVALSGCATSSQQKPTAEQAVSPSAEVFDLLTEGQASPVAGGKKIGPRPGSVCMLSQEGQQRDSYNWEVCIGTTCCKDTHVVLICTEGKWRIKSIERLENCRETNSRNPPRETETAD